MPLLKVGLSPLNSEWTIRRPLEIVIFHDSDSPFRNLIWLAGNRRFALSSLRTWSRSFLSLSDIRRYKGKVVQVEFSTVGFLLFLYFFYPYSARKSTDAPPPAFVHWGEAQKMIGAAQQVQRILNFMISGICNICPNWECKENEHLYFLRERCVAASI